MPTPEVDVHEQIERSSRGRTRCLLPSSISDGFDQLGERQGRRPFDILLDVRNGSRAQPAPYSLPHLVASAPASEQLCYLESSVSERDINVGVHRLLMQLGRLVLDIESLEHLLYDSALPERPSVVGEEVRVTRRLPTEGREELRPRTAHSGRV